MATILIVEDEPQISALVRSLIEEQGHKVLSAAAADEALGILNGPEAVDALFVDILLKGDMQAGIEFAKRAVELKPDLKVLYSTGLTVTDDMRAMVVPGSIILEKPYSEDQLLTRLANLLLQFEGLAGSFEPHRPPAYLSAQGARVEPARFTSGRRGKS